MQLRRLAALERQKIEDEYNALLSQIQYYEALLADPGRILGVIKTEVLALKEKFGDARRTQIMAQAAGDFSEEDLIRQDAVLISVTQGSYVKRTPLHAYRTQGRGGRGVQGMRTKSEDEVADLFSAHTLDHVLFFTNRGRVYGQRVFALPDAGRDAKGMPMVNVLNLTADERVTTLLVVPDFQQAKYVTLLTRQGKIKRVNLEEFEAVRPSGIIAMNLEPGDELGWARATSGKQDFIIVTAGGRALRFVETEVRAMGRTAAGVWAMQLGEDDIIASFDVVEPDGDLLVITQHGYGKRTPLSEFSPHGRYTGGQWALAHDRVDETGKVAAAHVVQLNDQVSVITTNGIALRTPVVAISQMSRMTRGVRIVNLDEGDTVAAMARLEAAVIAQAEASAPEKAAPRRASNAKPKAQEADETQAAPEADQANGDIVEAEIAVAENGANGVE